MLHADLILRNANIATLDKAGRFVSALAARDGRIVTTGDISAVKTFEGPDTQVIDLDGRTAIPGIVDSHCHPDGYAARVAGWQDVSPVYIQSRDALLARIESVCEDLDDGEWFLGYRLNENKSGGYPTLAELDQAGGGRPVFILRTDGHLGLANSAAFAVVGITEDTTDPPFGCFHRHPDSGALTGLMRETATHLFLDHVHAADTPERIGAGLGTVFEAFLSHGITTVYNSLTGSVGIQAYQQLHEQGRLPLRIGIIISGREEGLAEAFVRAGIRSGFGDDWLRVIGVEWCPDCSTSGRTAAYYEAYQGTPVAGEAENNTGILLYELEDLKRRASAAHAAGLLVMVEGVGDRGIDFALDVIEAALQAHPRSDHRMRVEHCCYVTPEILDRLARLQVVDSSATGFMYELGDAYRANRGADAMAWMWPHRTLIDRGVPAPGHSDAWVCSPNPFTAMWSMVNRKTDSGQSLHESQAISVTEALRAYTTLGAFAGREENIKGSLEPGKLADVAVLDRDLFTIASDEIRSVQVDMTIVGGVVRYQRAGVNSA
ncbi:MAG: amidohydrolase family protein [Proteobacteria bacterium]|jgi:predicted amidohydrolase YtcJ|nr:amidohydrolase family protein [Pseudomonadota bacterium]